MTTATEQSGVNGTVATLYAPPPATSAVAVSNGVADGSKCELSAKHLDDLKRSGLNDDQIAACGFRSLYDGVSRSRIAQILGWDKYRGSLGNVLEIPYANPDGTCTGYSRLKPDTPRKGKKDSKPIKYEAPMGVPNRAYFPPGTRAVLNDPSKDLLITEGEKKAAKGDQEGLSTIGASGVWNWQKKMERDADGRGIGPRELIDDLAAIPWEGRRVFIVFDSDATTNPSVLWAEFYLAQELAQKGAVAKVVRLPEGPAGADGLPTKVGLDDYLVDHGAEGFRKLLELARHPEKPAITVPPGETKPHEAPDDPFKLAEAFVLIKCVGPEGLEQRYYRGEHHRWDGGYQVVPAKELQAEICAFSKKELDRANCIEIEAWKQAGGVDANGKLKPMPTVRKVTVNLVRDVIQAVGSKTLLRSSIEQPAWIKTGVEGVTLDQLPPAVEILACQNTLVHLPSLVSDRECLFPPTPAFFSANLLPYEFNIQHPEPAHWLRFLLELWEKDQESIDLMQEWFGYHLTPDISQQKILLILGPKRSGKGTLARVLAAMIGRRNVAGPTLSSLATNFGLWPLLGKSAAIISDARLSGRTDSVAVTERLLSISGEDFITVDRKNLEPVTTKLLTRFTILTNELPKLSDASGALAGRFLVCSLQKSWFGREDPRLTDRLLAELPGILLWSIKGWERLRSRGHFLQPASGRRLLRDVEDLSSLIGVFVRERCHVEPGAEVPIRELFACWCKWCEAKGVKEPGTEQLFGRDLRAVCSGIDSKQPGQKNGKRPPRVYVGIRLKTPAELQSEPEAE